MENAAAEQWCEDKSRMMEEMLGKEHDMVMHAIIPYCIGGGLDLYYYPNGISGTAIATKELSELPGDGSSNRVFRNYELVMFTKHRLNLDYAKDRNTAFGAAHYTINAMLNTIAPYSADAHLNPNDTSELPAEMRDVGGRCVIFDGYPGYSDVERAQFGLLTAIEVFRSEMAYARMKSGVKLLKKLMTKGYYPYSDMDRKPVA